MSNAAGVVIVCMSGAAGVLIGFTAESMQSIIRQQLGDHPLYGMYEGESDLYFYTKFQAILLVQVFCYVVCTKATNVLGCYSYPPLLYYSGLQRVACGPLVVRRGTAGGP